MIEEWQYLRQKHAGHTLRPVDPEEGVGESRPREAPSRAALRRLFGINQETQAPFLLHTGEKVGGVGELRHGCLQLDAVNVAYLVTGHCLHGLRLQHLITIERAAIQEHLSKANVVLHSAVQTAATHLKLRLLRDFKREYCERIIRPTRMHARKPRPLRRHHGA